jgi:hypothetical protein
MMNENECKMIKKRILKSGPPKQAENPIRDRSCLAITKSATISGEESHASEKEKKNGQEGTHHQCYCPMLTT